MNFFCLSRNVLNKLTNRKCMEASLLLNSIKKMDCRAPPHHPRGLTNKFPKGKFMYWAVVPPHKNLQWSCRNSKVKTRTVNCWILFAPLKYNGRQIILFRDMFSYLFSQTGNGVISSVNWKLNKSFITFWLGNFYHPQDVNRKDSTS